MLKSACVHEEQVIRMKNLYPWTQILVLSFVIVGCASPTLHISVPNDFHGEIDLLCGEVGKGDISIAVDRSGHAPEFPCPRKEAKVFLLRNGKTYPIYDAEWRTTGDGIPRGIRIKIQ